MQITLEIDDKTVEQIDEIAKGFHKSRLQYINETLENSLRDDFLKKRRNDSEKVKRLVESYEEYEIWLDEQVWD